MGWESGRSGAGNTDQPAGIETTRMVTALEYAICEEKLGDQKQTFPRGAQRQARRQQAQVETL